MGGPANNAGLVFLNPRTNRHLQRGREREIYMPGHSARCTQLPRAAVRRAHLSLFLFFLYGEKRGSPRGENDLTVLGARARDRAPRRRSSPMNYRALPDRGTPRAPGPAPL